MSGITHQHPLKRKYESFTNIRYQVLYNSGAFRIELIEFNRSGDHLIPKQSARERYQDLNTKLANYSLSSSNVCDPCNTLETFKTTIDIK
jgi:hypothetical protein